MFAQNKFISTSIEIWGSNHGEMFALYYEWLMKLTKNCDYTLYFVIWVIDEALNKLGPSVVKWIIRCHTTHLRLSIHISKLLVQISLETCNASTMNQCLLVIKLLLGACRVPPHTSTRINMCLYSHFIMLNKPLKNKDLKRWIMTWYFTGF